MENDYTLDTVSIEPRSSGGTPQHIRRNPATNGINRGDDCVALQMPASMDESPPVHSLLICPAHWHALLESAPVSLVIRREGRRTSEDNCCDGGEGGREEDEGGMVRVMGDNSVTPQERQSPERDQECQNDKAEREKQMLQVNLQMDTDAAGSTSVIPLASPTLPFSTLPSSHLPSPTLPSSHLPSPTLPSSRLPSSTLPSSHLPSPTLLSPTSPSTTSVSITVDLTQNRHNVAPSQGTQHLSIQIDEEGAGQQRHSGEIPSQINPVSDSDIPWFRRPDYLRRSYQTHSRNVSETPSLPPFYSSSTSSAYHSRNSSLGSQLSSSCFESDSMLSQITDRDSSSAGSHGDLKPTGRLQDSRLRLLDSSPGSYSSDLCLHHHRTHPIRLQDTSLLEDSPNFEDTLRSGRDLPIRTMVMAENMKLRSFKSSEWIKKGIEKGSLVQVKVSSKTKHVVHFNVKAGDVIIWEFATKKRDIAFGVSFEPTEVATEQIPLASDESVENKVTAILPMFRVSAHARPTLGSHTAVQDGIYEIIWDNTYSRFFAKELFYRITTEPSEPNANYLQQ